MVKLVREKNWSTFKLSKSDVRINLITHSKTCKRIFFFQRLSWLFTLLPFIFVWECVMISMDVVLEFTSSYHAVDLIDRLRHIPSREALTLRAEARLWLYLFFCVSHKSSYVTLLTVCLLCLHYKHVIRLPLWLQHWSGRDLRWING